MKQPITEIILILSYVKYILVHKYNVTRQGIKLLRFCSFLEKLQLITRLIFHDVSKFTLGEFVPYYLHKYKFKGIKDKPEEVELMFSYGFNYHQKYNDHHWQFWLMNYVGEVKALDIPKVPLLEMLADWGSFNKKIFHTLVWYEENKNKIILNNNTRLRIENYLGMFEELGI